MKLADLYEAKLEKAGNRFELVNSIVRGKFTKDGSQLIPLGDFSLFELGLTSLKGCPLEIPNGCFSCDCNNLTTLEGGPTSIRKDYMCDRNLLKSLKGAPKIVPGVFICYSNGITTLEGAPEKIGDNFHCGDNRLTTLKDIHKHIKKIGGVANFEHNKITSNVLGLLKIKNLPEVVLDNEKVQDIINKYLPEGDILACVDELTDAGFEEYAKF